MLKPIKKFIKWFTDWKTWDYILFIVLIVVMLVLGLFYWIQIRPTNIKSSCHESAFSRFEVDESEVARLEKGTWSSKELKKKRIDEFTEKSRMEFLKSETYATYYSLCLRENGLK